MRWWSLFLILNIMSVCAYAEESPPPSDSTSAAPATTAPTNSASAAPATTPENSEFAQQLADWKSYPDFRQVENLSVLFHKSTTNFQKGVVVFLPEWQQIGTLTPLAKQLNQEGYDTVILFPQPEQLTVNPGDEKAQDAIKKLSENISAQLASIETNFPTTTGHRLMIAQGSNAIWLAGMIANKAVNSPDAIVLLNGLYPNQQANQLAATQLSTLQIPVLDLYQPEFNHFLDSAAQSRREASQQSNKLNWRQRQITQMSDAPRQLSSWMIALGWK